MIKVTITLVPFGQPEYQKEIGQVIVWNTGEQTGNKHLYDFEGWITDMQEKTVWLSGNNIQHDRTNPVSTLLSILFSKISKNIKEQYNDHTFQFTKLS